MGTTRRHFFFLPDGTLKRISQKLMDQICTGQERLPEYAGQSIREATVYLSTDENHRPIDILSIETTVFPFNEKGNAQPGLAKSAMTARVTYERLNDGANTSGNIYDLKPKLERDAWERKSRWQPIAEEVEQLNQMIWKKART